MKCWSFWLYALLGDGDAFGLTGPTGSSQIETLFQAYFDERNTPWNATAFDGRSDYGECASTQKVHFPRIILSGNRYTPVLRPFPGCWHSRWRLVHRCRRGQDWSRCCQMGWSSWRRIWPLLSPGKCQQCYSDSITQITVYLIQSSRPPLH